jgi:hypothetical protein
MQVAADIFLDTIGMFQLPYRASLVQLATPTTNIQLTMTAAQIAWVDVPHVL